jgi:hypothetical protein
MENFLGVKRKHLRNTKKNTFFYKYEKIKKSKIKISAIFPWFPQPQKANRTLNAWAPSLKLTLKKHVKIRKNPPQTTYLNSKTKVGQ